MEPHPPYSVFPILSCGPDWLTATSELTGVSNRLEDWAMGLLHERKAADGQISAAAILGYRGYSTSGLFIGRRPRSVMLRLSGPCCAPLATQAIRLASNVSRIDLQVTVWTEGEPCHLARWTRDRLLERERLGAPKQRFSLTEGNPDGETLAQGRRISDAYVRLYDKTAEARLGAPRLLWRYEVELKRHRAKQLAVRLAEQGCSPRLVCKLVHAWCTKKGVQPSFTLEGGPSELEPLSTGVDRNVLTWFRERLRVTVAKAVKQHGRETVLSALGLSDSPQ